MGELQDPGARLAACETALRLVLAHLAGPAVRARVELDDLVQEVYLRALTAPGGLPDPTPPAPPTRVEGPEGPRGAERVGDGPAEEPLRRFLARLARNTVVDVARALRAARRDGGERRIDRQSWSRHGDDAVAASRLAARTRGPATRAAEAEESHRLVAAFGRLDPDHRRVIGLRRFEGLSAREAARRLGRSEAAVHSLLRRALVAWEEQVSRGIHGESPADPRP